MLLSGFYNIHGISILVEAIAMDVIREVDALLYPFARASEKRPDYTISISPTYPGNREFLPPGRVLWDGKLPDDIRATYWGDETRRCIKLHELSLACFDLATCHAEISFKPGAEWCLLSGSILPILAEFLRQADHHMIHAATLLVNSSSDRAVVISGAGGAGKTTTSLALANSGMKIVSDDISFITGVGVSRSSPDTMGTYAAP